MNTPPYTTKSGYTVAHIDLDANDNDLVKCGCRWKGTVGDVADVVACVLTAGDRSPMGRCPQCDELLYPPKRKRKP